ncbi:MAG: hypothetical protein ABJF88_03905 [Rhodothermales bacterium]
MRGLVVGTLLLLVVGVGPAAAQSPAALRAAMLHGARTDVAPMPHRMQGEHGSPLRAPAAVERVLPSPVAPDTLRDPWLGRDKVLHAAGSFLLTLSAQYVLTSKLDTDEDTAVPIAAGSAFSLGLAKEVADSRRPVRPLFSTRDLVADAVGVALAVGLILL